MEFSKYQEEARKTAIYPENYKILYPALGLAGEAGEVCGKIKKILRDKNCDFNDPTFKDLIFHELGDVLWYLAILAQDLNLDFGAIAGENIIKLKSRQERGVLGGSGDNR